MTTGTNMGSASPTGNGSTPAPQVQAVAADVSVAPQLDAAGVAWAAQAGFRSIVNNRPDGEGGAEQPPQADLARAAEQAGLRYVYLPVQTSGQTPEDVARFAQLLQELPRPILAFCRSGSRSGRLYRAATGEG